MSRFDELKPLVNEWRNNCTRLYREYQRLPWFLSNCFKTFMGCPDTFKDGFGPEAENVPYICPAVAEWNEEQEKFRLIALEHFTLEDWSFFGDGRFYFALRIFLESAPNTYPKQPFWFLLSAVAEDVSFNVRVQKTKTDFNVRLDSAASADDLCEHLFSDLKHILVEEPLLRPEDSAGQFGFVKNK